MTSRGGEFPVRWRRAGLTYAALFVVAPSAALFALDGCSASAADPLGYHIEMAYSAGGKIETAWIDYRCRTIGPRSLGLADRALDEKTVRIGGTGPLKLTLSWDWLYRGAPCPPTYYKPADKVEEAPPVMVMDGGNHPRTVWFIRTTEVRMPRPLADKYIIAKFAVRHLAEVKEGRQDRPDDYRALKVFAPRIELVGLPETTHDMPVTRAHPLWQWLAGQPSKAIAICDIARFNDILLGLEREGVDIDCGRAVQRTEPPAPVKIHPYFLDYAGNRVWRISNQGRFQPIVAISSNHPDCLTKKAGAEKFWDNCIATLGVDGRYSVEISDISNPLLVWDGSENLLYLVRYKSEQVLHDAMEERP